MRTLERLTRITHLAATIGATAAAKYLFYRRLGRGGSDTYTIRPSTSRHPLVLRRDSSDPEVFKQIFIEREYAVLDRLADVRLVIDCGANIGCSSAYLLTSHPGSEVIAVEPDSGNFELLERNLAPWGARARCVKGAVWSRATPLVLSGEVFRDGKEWTRQVRPARAGETGDVEAFDIASLLARSGHDRISILKVDVEGAEAVIFSENYEPWIDKAEAIVCELHDDATAGAASRTFFAAIAGRGFTVSTVGELTVCVRGR